MKITEILKAEHRLLLRLMDRVEEAQRQGATAAERRAMMALMADVLEDHATVEDAVLFPALEPVLGRRAGPLAVMDMEHDRVRDLLHRTQDPDEEMTGILQEFFPLARDHFAKEEQVLFPMAEQLLGEARLAELGRSPRH